MLTGKFAVSMKKTSSKLFFSILTGKFAVSIEKTQANLVFLILTENIPVRFKTITQTSFFQS